MSYEFYRFVFIGGAILAGIMLVVSVLLFFLLKIPHVVGDLSGRNARKAIENIRNQNESTGNKYYKPSHVNRERGKITDKISPSGNLVKNPSGGLGVAMPTEKISTQELSIDPNATDVLSTENTTDVLSTENTTDVLKTGNETEVLNTENETAVLSTESGVTTVLGADSGETAVLSADVGETAVLSEEPSTETLIFEIEYETTFVHTDEVIA
ncbi:MAG: hypothetical protein IJP27_08365 [Clostridia bacterium]|nr:hypothetical protein [Clostridia bacterium]